MLLPRMQVLIRNIHVSEEWQEKVTLTKATQEACESRDRDNKAPVMFIHGTYVPCCDQYLTSLSLEDGCDLHDYQVMRCFASSNPVQSRERVLY